MNFVKCDSKIKAKGTLDYFNKLKILSVQLKVKEILDMNII